MSAPGTCTCRGQGPLRLATAVLLWLLGPLAATPPQPAWTSRLHDPPQPAWTSRLHDPPQPAWTSRLHDPPQPASTSRLHDPPQPAWKSRLHDPPQSAWTSRLHDPPQSAWTSRLNGHSQHTADVTMTMPVGSLLNERRRRESGASRDVLPLTLTFTFTVGQEEIKLSLRKNQFVSTEPPVFFIRHGKVVQEATHQLKNDHDLAFYQDQGLGASVMAACPDGLHYQLVGSYFHRGQEYSIEPIIDRVRNDHDHRIYRLPAQSHLKHDVIPFMPGPYTRGMEEAIPEVTAANSERDNRKFTDSVSEVSCNVTDSEDSNVSCDSTNNTHLADRRPDTRLTSPLIAPDWTTGRSSPASASSEVSSGHNLNHSLGHNLIQSLSNDPNHDPNPSPDSTQSQKQKLTPDWAGGGVRPGDRRKRRADNYIVELAMVIDHGVYQVWHDGVTDLDGEMRRTETIRRITQFYSFILNGIDLRYSSVRRLADLHMDVTWAGIVIMDTPVEDYWLGVETPPTSSRGRVESSLLLETFRTWAGNLGAQLPPSDHVMLFTGHNLTYGGSVSNAGLAYLGSACNLDFFFSIVEEYFDFRDVAIAAHELGHSLGARHDMDGNLCLAQDRYIMTSRFQFPSERKARNPWLFSRCSVQYFRDFIQELDRNETNCLLVQDSGQEKEILPYLLSLPGEVYPRDDFCRIGDGPSSYICRDRHGSDYSNICYGGVSCYSPTEGSCLPRLPPDGFSCGNQKWCINGTCHPSDQAPVTTGDDCPFGDRPDTAGAPSCADRVTEALSECYRDTFRAECCASCFRYKSSLPGCEYGDQFPMCVREQCVNYDLEYARDNCCSTCAQLLFTLPITMETTTAMFSVHSQPMGNSSKTTDMTSRVKNNSSDWRNHIASPEKSPRRETEARGRIWDQTAQNGGQRLWRGRGGLESSESAESDEDMPRDLGWSPNSDLTSDARKSSRTATGSQRVLRDLLDNIRNGQLKVSRSQRPRLLTNFLDRIRRHNLGNI